MQIFKDLIIVYNVLWHLSWMFAGQEWQVVLRRVSCQRPKSEREVNVGLFL